MNRYWTILLLLLLGTVALAAETTVTVNGKTVTVPVIEANGKAYLDVVTLAKLLGWTASFDAVKHAVAISNTSDGAGGDTGTPELPGDHGALNKVYILSKTSPLFFSLKSAEFTTAQVRIGDNIYVPSAKEKLLVLHFTVQNPQHTELLVRSDSLRFTVVDANNENHEGTSDWGIAGKQTRLNQQLKPAQKVEAYAVITMPAKGNVPKLMVLPSGDNDGPVLRYDLSDQVTGLKAPIADPADPTGATALATVPATLNTAYPMKNFDVTVQKIAYTTDALLGDAPAEGEKYLVVTLLTKNQSPDERLMRNDTYTPVVTTTDGDTIKYNDMLLATADRACNMQVKAGAETIVRLYFTVPKGITLKTLSIKEDDSREYELPIKE